MKTMKNLKTEVIKETTEFAEKFLTGRWTTLWNTDERKIQIYEFTKKGIVLVCETQKLKEKPSWVRGEITSRRKYRTAYRDEKESSLPHHTRQLSHNKHLGDTCSATPTKPKGSKGVVQRGAKEKRRKARQNTTQAEQ